MFNGVNSRYLQLFKIYFAFVVPSNMLQPSTDRSKAALLCRSSLLYVFRVLSVYCTLVTICQERAEFLVLLYVMFSCVSSLSHVVSWVSSGT